MSQLVKETLKELGIRGGDRDRVILQLAVAVHHLKRRVDQLERADSNSIGSRFKNYIQKIAPPARTRA